MPVHTRTNRPLCSEARDKPGRCVVEPGVSPDEAGHRAVPGDNGVGICRAVETSARWDGAPLAAYPPGRLQVTILRATIPSYATLPKPPPMRLSMRGLLLRGELTIIAETAAERTFRAGEGIVEQVGAALYGENRSGGETGMAIFMPGHWACRSLGIQKYNLKL